MKTLLFLTILSSIVFVSGCGQTGPLYLPKTVLIPAQTPPPPPSAAEENNDIPVSQ